MASDGIDVTVVDLTSAGDPVEVVRAGSPHVVLLDLNLGASGRGVDLVGPLTEAGSAVVIVSASTDEAEIGAALVAGASGWVPKEADYGRLVAAVRQLVEGQPILDPATRNRLVDAWLRADRLRSGFDLLTPREAEVLAGLMRGLSVERIAAESYVSPLTVRSQVRSVLQKLGVRSQLEAVALAFGRSWQPVRADLPPRAALHAPATTNTQH